MHLSQTKWLFQPHGQWKLFLSLMGSHMAQNCVLKVRPEGLANRVTRALTLHPRPRPLEKAPGVGFNVHKQPGTVLCTPTSENCQFICEACAGAGVLSRGLKSLGP